VFDVRYWHVADIPKLPINVRIWGKSGHLPACGGPSGTATLSAMTVSLTMC
jgi:hypothetical protein